MAAIGLYQGKLKYINMGTEDGYYADGEDAFKMKLYFDPKEQLEKMNEQKKLKMKFVAVLVLALVCTYAVESDVFAELRESEFGSTLVDTI